MAKDRRTSDGRKVTDRPFWPPHGKAAHTSRRPSTGRQTSVGKHLKKRGKR